MKIIFSPTKTLKKIENDYEYSIPKYLDISNEINEIYNVKKEEVNQAIFYYNGISFKYLDVSTLSKEDILYLNNNLIILSALYGELKPLDLINNYRLDFTNKKLYNYFNIEYDEVINLASKEYSRLIKGNLINIEFKEFKNNKLTTSGTYNKMLRGLMLRYITINKIEDINELKKFKELDYKFNSELSTNNNLVYTKGI